MRLVFVGTRGEIDARSPHHRRHTSTIIVYRGKRILVDCGQDWLHHVAQLRPGAIILTHAHPDHAAGLKAGAPCAVYATHDTWAGLRQFPIERKKVIEPRQPMSILGVKFEAFTVEHSILAHAVGYRVQAPGSCIFYAPDVVYIHQQHEALTGIHLYIGDGATITRPFIRRRGSALIGHSPIRRQLVWCRKENVSQAVFTHCGSEIVTGEEAILREQLREMGAEFGVQAQIAYDGLKIELRHAASGMQKRRASK